MNPVGVLLVDAIVPMTAPPGNLRGIVGLVLLGHFLSKRW